MDSFQLLWLARLAKCQSDIASMYAANEERNYKGFAIVYDEDAFTSVSSEIQQIINEIETYRRSQ